MFVLSGAEDLVPGAGPDVVRDGFAVRRYRPRIEGAFTRIERWTRQSDGDTHWRTIARDNVLTVYGSDADSRIADPDDPRRVFGWLVCARYDDRGNAAVFSYAAEDASQVDGSAAHEAHRTREANRYPKRIRYGNRKPLLLDTGVDGMRRSHVPAPDFSTAGWMFEVVFDYGEHEALDPKPNDAGNWFCRRDAFSTYRAGFEVRTYRLCRRVLEGWAASTLAASSPASLGCSVTFPSP